MEKNQERFELNDENDEARVLVIDKDVLSVAYRYPCDEYVEIAKVDDGRSEDGLVNVDIVVDSNELLSGNDICNIVVFVIEHVNTALLLLTSKHTGELAIPISTGTSTNKYDPIPQLLLCWIVNV